MTLNVRYECIVGEYQSDESIFDRLDDVVGVGRRNATQVNQRRL